MAKIVRAILGIKDPKPPRPDFSDKTTKLTGVPLSVIYGKAHVTGNIVWRNVSADKKTLSIVVALCWGPVNIDAHSIRINGKRPEYINDGLNENRKEAPEFLTGVRVTMAQGYRGQTPLFGFEQGFNRTAYLYVTAQSSNDVNDISEVECDVTRGDLFTASDYQTPIPSGISAVRSSNPIAAALDYLLNIEYGPGKSTAEFGDLASWISAIAVAEANIATQQSNFTTPVWTGMIGTTITDGGATVTKSAGDGSSFNAAARTSESIGSYGSLRFKFGGTGDVTSVGLGTFYVIPNYTNQDEFGWQGGAPQGPPGGEVFTDNPMGLNYSLTVDAEDGSIWVVEEAGWGYQVPGPRNVDDIFEIEITPSGARYKKNGTQFYASTSRFAPPYPLFANVFFQTPGAHITIVNWTRSASSTEYRYSIGAEVGKNESDTHLSIANDILEVANAECYDSNGIIKCWTAKATASSGELTRANFTPAKVETADMTTIYNVIELEYRQAEDGEKRLVTWQDPALISDWGERRQKIAMTTIPTREQASRKVALVGRRAFAERLSLTGYADHSFFTVEPGDVLNVTMGSADVVWFASKPFWVTEVVPENKDGQVELSLREYGGDALYDDTASDTFDQNDPLYSHTQTPIHNDTLVPPQPPWNFAAEVFHVASNPLGKNVYIRLSWAYSVQPDWLNGTVVIYRRQLGSSDPYVIVGSVAHPAVSYDDWSVQPDIEGYEYVLRVRSNYGVLSALPTLTDYDVRAGQLNTVEQVSNINVSLVPNTDRPGKMQYNARLSWDASVQTDGDVVKIYEIAYIKNKDPNVPLAQQIQIIGQTLDDSIVLEDVTVGDYEFRITTILTNDRRSPAKIKFYVLTDNAFNPLPEVTGLEIFGKGNGTAFTGQDVKFVWRLNNPSTSQELGSERFGGDTGQLDTFFYDYKVTIKDPDTDEVLRIESVKDTSYTYTLLHSIQDGGPYRSVKIEVQYRDQWNRTSNAAKLTATNPPPPAPQGLLLEVGAGVCFFNYIRPADPDFKGTVIYASDTTGFTPSEDNLVFRGNDYVGSFPITPGENVYLRVGSFDEFGETGITLSAETEVFGLHMADTTAPAIPTGLFLGTAINTGGDGTQQSLLGAEWDANTEADMSFYELAISENGGGFVYYTAPNNGYVWNVTAGHSYDVKVRAVDTSGNRSGYSAPFTRVAAGDTVAPAAPTDLAVTAVFKNFWVTWTNPADLDLDYIEVWSGATTDPSLATVLARVKGTAFVHSGLATGATQYYWIRAIDTSGNASPGASGVGIGGTLLGTATADYQALSITNAKIADLAVDNAKIASLDAGKLTAGSVITGSVLVGTTSLTAIAASAADPAAAVNANTTLIEPGLIKISGSTKLSDWQQGGDLTKINGGAISANTITANKMEIGVRGIEIIDLQFQPVGAGSNVLNWSSGTVSYTNTSGTPVTQAVSGGNVTWTTGTQYIYWTEGNNILLATTTQATARAAGNIVMATYTGGVRLVPVYGRTTIDGSTIITGSVTATQIAAGSITATEIQAGTIVADRIAVGTITTDRIISQGVSQTYETLTNSGAFFPGNLTDSTWTDCATVYGITTDGTYNIHITGDIEIQYSTGSVAGAPLFAYQILYSTNGGSSWSDYRSFRGYSPSKMAASTTINNTLVFMHSQSMGAATYAFKIAVKAIFSDSGDTATWWTSLIKAEVFKR